MNVQETVQLLSERMPEIRRRFGVRELAIFGSVARNEARPDSDCKSSARGPLHGGFPPIAPCNPRPNSVPYRCEMYVRDMSPSAEALV